MQVELAKNRLQLSFLNQLLPTLTDDAHPLRLYFHLHWPDERSSSRLNIRSLLMCRYCSVIELAWFQKGIAHTLTKHS
jgi:hypothetical protein